MLVGRVPSRGALLAFPSECEISRLAPLAGQGESGPKEWVSEFMRREAKYLCHSRLNYPPFREPYLNGLSDLDSPVESAISPSELHLDMARGNVRR